MAFFLFIDESGQDQGASPYEVLAGFAVEDQSMWNLILALREAEQRQFGMRYTSGSGELKARKLLKRKTFRLAQQMDLIDLPERAELAKKCLEEGAFARKRELTALAQAKLEYVKEVFEICARFRCRMFASIVSPDSPRIESDKHLRKDYAYLFERFFYFLEDTNLEAMGIIVFDELETSKSLNISGQMHRYFLRSEKGRFRASQVVPEPFFVHSELTSGVQVADILAYVISWGFRTPVMDRPARNELRLYVDQICRLRYRAIREVGSDPNFAIWSFGWIDDLRTYEDRNE